MKNKKYLLILVTLISCSQNFEGFEKFKNEVNPVVLKKSLIQKKADFDDKMSNIRTASNLENRDLASIVIKIDRKINLDYDTYLNFIETNFRNSIVFDYDNKIHEEISNEVLSFVKFENAVVPIPSLKTLSEKHLYLQQYFQFSKAKVHITDYQYGYFFKDEKYELLGKEMNFYKDHGYTTGALVDEELGRVILFIFIW